MISTPTDGFGALLLHVIPGNTILSVLVPDGRAQGLLGFGLVLGLLALRPLGLDEVVHLDIFAKKPEDPPAPESDSNAAEEKKEL